MPFFQWIRGVVLSQREGNCPLNARARALGAVKEAIAYSMAALLLAGKLGTFIQSNYMLYLYYVFRFIHAWSINLWMRSERNLRVL